MRALLLLSLVAAARPASAESAGGAGTFASPLAPELIDQAATAQWVDGRETSRADFLEPPNKVYWKNQVTWFLAMPGARVGSNGIAFGASTSAGPRHLRVGFVRDVPVGTVLTRGTITRVAVLRADAAYPGDLGRDADWIEAAPGAPGELALWVLPPGTRTRAVRFTVDLPASREPTEARLRGASLFVERLVNVARDATALASSHEGTAQRLNDGSFEEWSPGPWDDDDGARAGALSRERPEWVMLVWPRRVSLRGLGAFFPFFGEAEAQVYAGPDRIHPREADERSWRTIATTSFPNTFPETLASTWIDFGRVVSTRAVRLRIVSPVAVEGHYLPGRSHGGKRVSLGELMAVEALAEAPAPVRAAAAAMPHPPIAVPFTMPEAGYATLVLEDASGRRVRNLLADTWFAAGPQVAWWDGLDESGRIDGPQHAAHGIYTSVGAPVAPGTYAVRGLFHGPLSLAYELSVYSPGSPPWMTGTQTDENAGGWLSDHASPTAALFLPGPTPRMLLASPVAEAGHGLIWTDLAGRKLDGKRWVGGSWTGASHLARDDGPLAARGVSAYAGVSWEGKLRLTAIKERDEAAPIASDALAALGVPALGGLAARDGVLFASLPATGRLLRVDATNGAVLGQVQLPDGRGLAFDARGRLLALSGRRLLAFDLAARAPGAAPPALGAPRVVVASGLEDPRALAVDARGDIYVADWGGSHQVKVLDADGRLLRVVGRPGGAVAGPYDPRRMNRPAGLAVDRDGRLWVAEDSWAPKRVSVWTPDGALATAVYGPPQYGGGGAIDPRDRSRFYYAGQGQRCGLEFAVDWATGTSTLRSITWLDAPDANVPPGDTGPETPIYVGGRQYLTDAFNARPVGGPQVANVWLMRGARAARVASFGEAYAWPLLRTPAFLSRWPTGPAPPGTSFVYAWSDLDDDGRVEPEEVTIARDWAGTLTVNERLELTTATATVYAPEGFTASGAPRYDARHGRAQATGFSMHEVLSGSGTVMALGDGWTLAAGGPVRGFRDGAQRWTYPNEWPSQQAGVSSPAPTRPGELMATTRIMAQTLRPTPGKVGDVGEIAAINGDKGVVFLMTADGLFVSTLFHDVRLASESWNMPEQTRGMRLDELTLHDEAFWTNVSQTRDGSVFLVAGQNHSSVVRVGGLETLRPLAAPPVVVTPAALVEAQAARQASELERQRRVGRDLWTIPLDAGPVAIDGDLGDWSGAAWVVVNEGGGPMGRVEAAGAVADGRLCLAFRTGDPALLTNTGEAWRFSFATGGALDLMLGGDPRAAPGRAAPAPGDVRLVVTRVAGKTRAVLYRPKAPGARGRPVSFGSPWRTITMDEVVDVSAAVTLAQKGGAYELAVPLATLGLRPRDGLELRGDVGVLHGDGSRTVQRLYWQNKIASTVADIPTEASLTPALWGRLRFVAPTQATGARKRVMLRP